MATATAVSETWAVKVDALFRGNFTTFDHRHPRAVLIAVLGGRIVAMDDEAEALEAPVQEDFGQCAVFPGFHDAHCHTAAFGLGLSEVDLSSPPLTSLEGLYAAVAERAAGLRPGDWVVGSGFDQNKLGGSHPSGQRLDVAAGGRPVWLKHTSGHMCVVSSAVLAMIGSAADDPIEGGRVATGSSGEPTGLLEEKAQSLVQRLRQAPSVEQIAAAIGQAHQRYLSEGLTSVCEAGVGGGWVSQSPLELSAYQLARDSGRLGVRTTAMISASVLHELGGNADGALVGAPNDGLTRVGLDAGIRSGLGDEWLRIGALKVFSDGSLIGRTCWMHDGFADDAGNTGYPQADPAEMRATILDAHAAGWQVATHAIGDAAVDFVLDCYSEALRKMPRADHRHRIEHCGVADDVAVAEMAALGVIAVPQGRFVGEIGDGMMAALGQQRVPRAYRLRSLLDAGIILPGSSDRPVVDGRPLLGIRDMVSRSTQSGAPFSPSEALTAEQALYAYTVGSAVPTRSEHERGRLAPGMLADFAVLAADPREVPPAEISDVPVVATVVGGEMVFRSLQ